MGDKQPKLVVALRCPHCGRDVSVEAEYDMEKVDFSVSR